MRKLSLYVGALLILLAGACNEDPVQYPETSNFFQESFANLDIATLGSLETPYESTFSSSSPGARTKGGFADIAEIASRLAEIFPDADVLEIESDIERGLEVWAIKLVMPGGGILKIEFVQELGEIIKMKGKTGPYDYEINPGGSFITFSAAKQIALDAVGGEIVKWNLELEEENNWEYEFHIVTDTQRFEVEINAFTGEVLSVKEKHEGDDEDNDGEEEGEDEGHDEDVNTPAPAGVSEFVLNLFPGEIKHSEKEEEHDVLVWKLYVVNEAGSAVKFLTTEDPVELVKMEGEKGPFDYNIEPGNDILSLNQAKDIISREAEGETVEWELKKKSTDEGHLWIYKFEVRDGDIKYEIELDAKSGEFLKFETDD